MTLDLCLLVALLIIGVLSTTITYVAVKIGKNDVGIEKLNVDKTATK